MDGALDRGGKSISVIVFHIWFLTQFADDVMNSNESNLGLSSAAVISQLLDVVSQSTSIHSMPF